MKYGMIKDIQGDKMNNNLLVLQSDFGLVDGAVSAMIGVALEESPTLLLASLFLIACLLLILQNHRRFYNPWK